MKLAIFALATAILSLMGVVSASAAQHEDENSAVACRRYYLRPRLDFQDFSWPSRPETCHGSRRGQTSEHGINGCDMELTLPNAVVGTDGVPEVTVNRCYGSSDPAGGCPIVPFAVNVACKTPSSMDCVVTAEVVATEEEESIQRFSHSITGGTSWDPTIDLRFISIKEAGTYPTTIRYKAHNSKNGQVCFTSKVLHVVVTDMEPPPCEFEVELGCDSSELTYEVCDGPNCAQTESVGLQVKCPESVARCELESSAVNVGSTEFSSPLPSVHGGQKAVLAVNVDFAVQEIELSIAGTYPLVLSAIGAAFDASNNPIGSCKGAVTLPVYVGEAKCGLEITKVTPSKEYVVSTYAEPHTVTLDVSCTGDLSARACEVEWVSYLLNEDELVTETTTLFIPRGDVQPVEVDITNYINSPSMDQSRQNDLLIGVKGRDCYAFDTLHIFKTYWAQKNKGKRKTKSKHLSQYMRKFF